MSIQTLLVGLTEANLDFIVVGGVAGAIHGSPFVTNDLDICYDTRPANVTRTAKLWSKWSVDPRTLRTTPKLTLRTSQGDLDLLDKVEGVGAYADALESSEEITAFAIRFRVLTLDALIRARRASTRPKDLAQLPTLEALADLRAR